MTDKKLLPYRPRLSISTERAYPGGYDVVDAESLLVDSGLHSDVARPGASLPSRKGLATGGLIAFALLFTGACSTPVATGQLGELQQLHGTCPAEQRVEYAGIDISGSGQQHDIAVERRDALEQVVTNTAVCEGYLRVIAFTGSAAASAILFDAHLSPAGATEIARLRKVPDLVASTMQTIDTKLSDASQRLDPDGSDIIAQFRLAAELAQQLTADGTKVQLALNLLTDGVQTVGVVLNTDALTPDAAVDLANRAPVVTLPPTATIKISGLGKTAGSAAPTAYIDALKVFYSTYGTRTGAASCIAVTDYS